MRATLEDMEEFLTPSARRAVQAAHHWAARLNAPRVRPEHLLLALAQEEESRGATILSGLGLPLPPLCRLLGIGDALEHPAAAGSVTLPLAPEVRGILAAVRTRSLRLGPDGAAGTDVLLLELLKTSADLRRLLGSPEREIAGLLDELELQIAADTQPLAAAFAGLDLSDATERFDVYRVLDASANRAREGLRVLEDYARFVCDDPQLTRELKEMRHQLREALDLLPSLELLESRDTAGDVGATLSTADEWSRAHVHDVVAANFKRTQEALRSLEEFSKLECLPMAQALERIRYRMYGVERAAVIGSDSRGRLEGVVLYVLVSSATCPGGLEWTVREALAGGAQAIQLREKNTPDRALVELAQRIRAVTRAAGALFIINDRADIARVTQADGVHVGQDELSVRQARRVLGSRALVGVSTHSVEQARQAVLDGASYIGVGPTFPSKTKAFQEFSGLELVRQAHAEIRLPAFVIGGIDLDRLPEVLAAGGRRVAVSSAVCAAADPCQAALEFRRRLESNPP